MRAPGKSLTGGSPSRRELVALAGALLLALAIRVGYVLLTRGHTLAGDEASYDVYGRLIVAGHWFWSTEPYGIAHASLWKAPGYPLWVGVGYRALGIHPDRLYLVQALVSTATVALTWVLGRRLFGVRAGLAAAFVVAVYPLAWQFDVRAYSEVLATPITVAVLIVALTRPPTRGSAMGLGGLMGVALLVRPSSVFLFAGVAVAWWLACGWRTGTLRLALAVGVAALCVLPWAYRNHHVAGGFVPISMQDAAAYGTFNDDSAHDTVWRWAWRPVPSRDRDLYDPRDPLPDLELRSRLSHRARRYALDHPASVPEAFFWNGLSRLWDVRRPARAVTEVHFEGRTKAVTIAGLVMYYPLLVLALAGLWRWRRRHELVWPVLAVALAASIVYTSDSGTRYHAPLEPLVVVLACGAVFGGAGITLARHGAVQHG